LPGVGCEPAGPSGRRACRCEPPTLRRDEVRQGGVLAEPARVGLLRFTGDFDLGESSEREADQPDRARDEEAACEPGQGRASRLPHFTAYMRQRG
jgi:hypothetical protein